MDIVDIWILAPILAGVGMILLGLYHVYRAICSKSWPSTTGTIIESELAETFQDIPLVGVEFVQEPKITYTYMVDGEKLQGKQIKFRIKFSSYSKESALRILARHPLNSTAKVYYNPRNPSDAVLIPGITIEMFAFIIIGVTLIVFGVQFRTLD